MRASEGEANTVAGVASETAGVSLGDTFGDQGLVAGGVTGSEGAGVDIDQTAGGVEGRVGDGGGVPGDEEQQGEGDPEEGEEEGSSAAA